MARVTGLLPGRCSSGRRGSSGGNAVHPPPSAGDEVVAMRSEDGYMVVNQDANWNVVSATASEGRVLERTFYTAYGLPGVWARAHRVNGP